MEDHYYLGSYAVARIEESGEEAEESGGDAKRAGYLPIPDGGRIGRGLWAILIIQVYFLMK